MSYFEAKIELLQARPVVPLKHLLIEAVVLVGMAFLLSLFF